MGTKVKNQGYLFIFCALMGAAAGGIVWLFLKVLSVGTTFLWEWIPAQFSLPVYPVLVCTLGGLIIGLFRKKYGDYPEELESVMGKVKRDKHYPYKNMVVMIIAALLPLLFGSSIGPEAGMTGIIVGLCYWVGDNLKSAKKYAQDYSEVGVTVTLGVLFHSPLFGIFEVVEEKGAEDNIVLPKASKLLLYGVSLAAGMGISVLLSNFFGKSLGGLPSLALENDPGWADYIMIIIYVLAGCLLAWIFEFSHSGIKKTVSHIPPVIRETAGGLCLGIMGMLIPVIMFSGEEQMGELSHIFGTYLPAAWMGIGILKILMTNLCIQSGLKGGHFFPVIFAGVAFAYGLAALVFPAGGHEVFAASIVTAALLGGTMKKPFAVTMLLALCFPARLCVWIFLAAVISSRIMGREKNVD